MATSGSRARCSSISTGLSLVFLALSFSSPGHSAVLTRGPYLQRESSFEITVRWRSDVATDSIVRFGSAPGQLTQNVTLNPAVSEHVVRVTGLNPAARYFYSIGSTTQVLAGDDLDHSFTTPPLTGVATPTRVWVIGDSGTANADARNVRDAFMSEANGRFANLWLMLGDNAYNDGTDAEYQAAVFDTYPQILRNVVLWPTLGNHDAFSANSPNETGVYYNIFTLPRAAEAGGVASGTEAYYSFDYGNIHFICLDSEDTDRSQNGTMLSWLQMDVASTTADWVIAFWHHPPYTKGSHNSDTESHLIEMRTNALPILEAAGVDLVLNGHSHSYERSWLLDSHYGLSNTFNPGTMRLDGGDGSPLGDGAYSKPVGGPAPHAGSVYVVAGSSGKIGGGALNHAAMFRALNVLGSVVLEISCGRLDARFIDDVGALRDNFSIFKGSVPPDGTNDLVVTFLGASRVDLQWTDRATIESAYEVERSTDGITFLPLTTLPANTTTFSDVTVLADTTYTYRVRAVNSTCPSVWSNTVVATTPLAVCGNSTVESGEQCDTGGDSSSCDSDCTFVSCGDTYTNPAAGEICDDGGDSSSCDSDCTLVACGDNHPNPTAGEACDTAGDSSTCDSDCSLVACGDNHPNPAAGEACDTAGDSPTCDSDCTLVACGDNHPNPTAGEACDTAGDSSTCDSDCTLVACGDNHPNPAAGESCDTAGDSPTCDSDCTPVACGDNHPNPAAGEACDTAGDSPTCDSDCTPVACGDNHLNPAAGEACDDGNTTAGDGCSDICQIESCIAANLSIVSHVLAVENGTATDFVWLPDAAALLYHLNSVGLKTQLLSPTRAGFGQAECDSLPSITTCSDPNPSALPGCVYYQVLSACDAAIEGPF